MADYMIRYKGVDRTGVAHTGVAHTGVAHTGVAHTGVAHTGADARRYAAQKAVDVWNTGGGSTDLEKLDTAIEALQAYRWALTAADTLPRTGLEKEEK
jgi:hypothetical protein